MRTAQLTFPVKVAAKWDSQVVLMVKNPRQCRRHKRHRFNPALGRSPGEGRDNPLQYSCLENPQGQRTPLGYSPRSCKESDITEVTEHACR